MSCAPQVQNCFEGGLTGEQGRDLREKLEQESVRAEALQLETERYKELADIASEQTLAMDNQVRGDRRALPTPSIFPDAWSEMNPCNSAPIK